jgi:uncharacterized protein VirK/YbjX
MIPNTVCRRHCLAGHSKAQYSSVRWLGVTLKCLFGSMLSQYLPGTISSLWSSSEFVCDGGDFTAYTRRIRFCLKALPVLGLVDRMVNAPRSSAMGRLMDKRPETLGAIIWPYQCLGWDSHTRLSRILAHYSVIDRIGGPLDFEADRELLLLDLHENHDCLRVTLDQPKWFMREGQLTINLFFSEVRLYSLAFSLFDEGDTTAALIGGIQGRNIVGALDLYRQLTKQFHGVRPRDLLLECFRTLCVIINVNRILAISEEYRHNRSCYFGNARKDKLGVDYNNIWEDRGGFRIDPMFYQLPLSQERDLASIPTKKRHMYRRRYDSLRSLREQMQDGFGRMENPRSRNPGTY